ncbi:PHP domain-containing protein [uncultured Phascolarctobacterium sp.]|uniref:PHP domain-containing protein n=1 Tax=uncultured Phascolarctobacterium sp. TaxID=512296 RepID=UPI0025E72C49|nr:PHP domain-containing protein [uncultured Phascolarctobacterium sp.]
MRVDLHIHTTASDGTWTPQELVEQALRVGLGAIAVTDHDSVANVAEAQRLAAAAGVKLLPAAEICSTKENLSFHILGYGIDIANKHLLELLQHNEALLEQKDVDSIALLQRDGWPVDAAEFARYTYDRRRGGWRALAYLQDKGLCSGVNDFFQRIFTPEHDLGFPTFPAIGQVVDAIKGAGGVAICAHAASGFHGPGLERVMDLLRTEPLDGFECYHSGHTEEGTKRLLRHCVKHGLLISGGSDCHGSFVPGRNLGEPFVDTSMLRLGGLL